jgi:hypothetical protein
MEHRMISGISSALIQWFHFSGAASFPVVLIESVWAEYALSADSKAPVLRQQQQERVYKGRCRQMFEPNIISLEVFESSFQLPRCFLGVLDLEDRSQLPHPLGVRGDWGELVWLFGKMLCVFFFRRRALDIRLRRRSLRRCYHQIEHSVEWRFWLEMFVGRRSAVNSDSPLRPNLFC